MSLSAIDSSDKAILRALATRVAEVAAGDEMEQRRKLWLEHNTLRSKNPVLYISPEGAWRELMPETEIQCTDRAARNIEWELRRQLYTAEHFQDDSVCIDTQSLFPPIEASGYGVEVQHSDKTADRGSYGFEPIIKDSDDLKEMQPQEWTYDATAHRQEAERLHDVLGEILPVVQGGVAHISFHLPSLYINHCGYNEMLMDMAMRPEFVHEVIQFFAEDSRRYIEWLCEQNLLELNNDNTYQNSGGRGWSDELPADGFDPDRVRPCDMWASAESQEFDCISPEMHEEFSLQYERELLKPFGLTGYGCCDDLTKKWDYVRQIPNLRRVSVAPWADVEVSAEQLKGDYIYSWKPNPAMMVGNFDAPAIRAYIRKTIDACQANGCVLEIILKDTHTCEHHPERFDEWTRIAREEIERVS
jgi:hypothetical protein